MSARRGPPKHQNKFAWKPHAGQKINETELGGKLHPYSEVTGVCPRCRDQIHWKRKYGKYKPITEPAKCQKCGKRSVRQAYHNICMACSKNLGLCAKCCCRVNETVGRDVTEVEAELKSLEEAVKHARERERRTLLRIMNKGKGVQDEQPSVSKITDSSWEGGKLAALSIDDYAAQSRQGNAAAATAAADYDTDTDIDANDDDDDNDEEKDMHDGQPPVSKITYSSWEGGKLAALPIDDYAVQSRQGNAAAAAADSDFDADANDDVDDDDDGDNEEEDVESVHN